MILYLSISTSLSRSTVWPKLQEMIPATVLGPAPGINDRILNYEVWESSFIVQNFLVSTFISCLPYFHIPHICFLPENISKVLHVLVNILFPLTEGTAFPSQGHVTFFITSHWSIMLKLWLFSLQSYPTLCASMDCSTPGIPVLHCVPEFAQIHVHWVGDAI